jgi:histidine ammonia-lyase
VGVGGPVPGGPGSGGPAAGGPGSGDVPSAGSGATAAGGPGAGAPAYVVLDGSGLDTAAVARLADRSAGPAVLPEAYARAERAWHTARRLADAGRMYGRHTGVGANRMVSVEPGEEAGQDLRLLRSHAGGAGGQVPGREVRAMLAVRANQVLAGGSGLQPALVTALVEALRLDVRPAVSEYGAVGTGDLTALAQTGLTLIGELPWVREPAGAGGPTPPGAGAGAVVEPVAEPGSGSVVVPVAGAVAVPGPLAGAGTGAVPAPVALERGDALAFMSSSALTLGQAALVCHDLDELLRATLTVAALSLAAVGGSLEAYAAPVHALRPYAGARRSAAEVRRLLGAPERPRAGGRRIQDPYGFRVFPQVHGAALDACDALGRILAVELNCPAENPLISEDGPDGGPAAYHHGGFYAAPLALALDALTLALLQTARLSAARLAHLGDPAITGLRAFLADGPAASSGIMILEYTAASALAEIRAAAAAPAAAGHTVLSRGLEEAASFATQGVRQARRAVEAYRQVVACELVAAARAVRSAAIAPFPGGAPVAAALTACGLGGAGPDRPLSPDVEVAVALLPSLATP